MKLRLTVMTSAAATFTTSPLSVQGEPGPQTRTQPLCVLRGMDKVVKLNDLAQYKILFHFLRLCLMDILF